MLDEQVRALLSAPVAGERSEGEPEMLFGERAGSAVVVRVFHYPTGPEVDAWLDLAQRQCVAEGGELSADWVGVYSANREADGDPPDIVLGLVSGQDLAVRAKGRRRR